MCLLMQWDGNGCSLSGGLNNYCTIWVTDKIRNRNAEYYLQSSGLKSRVCDFEIIEQGSYGFLMKKIFVKYRIVCAIESVKLLLLFGIKYSPLKNKKAILLSDWCR